MAKKKDKVRVDMGGVEGRVLLPEGEYVVEVESVELGESQSGNEMLTWVFKTKEHADKKLNGQKLWYYTVLNANSLWNLKNLLETLGVEVPDGPMDLDFDELVGEEMIGIVAHDEYDGKTRAKLDDFMPSDESGGTSSSGDDEGEEDVKVEGKKELPKLSEDEIRDMDEDDLKATIEKYDLDVNLDHRKYRTARKKVGAVVDALKDEGHLEEE